MSRRIREYKKLQKFDKQALYEIFLLSTKIIAFTVMGDPYFLLNILTTSLPHLNCAVFSLGTALESFFLLGFFK
jgi:hypothetical protein